MLPVPDTLPDRRLDQIFLPFAGLTEAESVIKYADGLKPRLPEPLLFDNSFGSIQWSCEPLPDEGGMKRLKVVQKIEVGRVHAPASMYSSLREFLSWVKQLDTRRITFIRERP
jgi:hypothetical protein